MKFSLLSLAAFASFMTVFAAPSPNAEAVSGGGASSSILVERDEDLGSVLTPVNATDADLVSTAATVGGYLYTGTYWSGTRGVYSVTTGVCYYFNAPWNNGMGSYQPNIGSYCTVWDSNTCTGGYISNMHYPGLENLQTFWFINVPSSIMCWLE